MRELSSATIEHDLCGPHGSEALTHGVKVTVRPEFRPEHSDVAGNRFVFAYHIRISNQSDRRVKLMSRHWTIIDADGEVNTVTGDGVVGEQPSLEPGESFEYASWCPLETPWGTMEGSFTMTADPSDSIRVRIGRFYLVAADSEVAHETPRLH